MISICFEEGERRDEFSKATEKAIEVIYPLEQKGPTLFICF